MPDLRPEENFEPSRETKTFWRFTRKSGATYAGVALPGIFETSHAVSDAALFFVVIILEVWGLANLLIVGGANPIYVVVLFILDITLAIIRHLPAGAICESRNRIVFAATADEIARLRHRITHGERFGEFISLLIALVAGVKIVSFWGLQPEFNGLTAGIMVSYLIAALIHVRVTGYFLFSLFTEGRCWLDRRRFLDAPDEENSFKIKAHKQHVFHCAQALKEVRVNRHAIELYNSPKAEESAAHRYVLKTWGVLMDHQLQALINAQADQDSIVVVAREGIKHQILNILQAEVASFEEATPTAGRV